MEQRNPLQRIWELGQEEHPKLILSIGIAIVGVICGLVPFVAGAHIIIDMLEGVQDFSVYFKLGMLALAGYAGKSIFYTMALSFSHEAAFAILKSIRQRILEKLPKLPLGTILDTSSGKLKQIIVDYVGSMETTLAHILPEFTSNLLGPALVVVYIFVIDWRMALISLISLVVGFSCMGFMMIGYEEAFKGAVKVTSEMSETMVEYIGGIEVVKAFNQGKNSYQKFKDKVLANAQFYYDWMKRCQIPQALAFGIAPATALFVLPSGWYFYQTGSLTMENFILIIILSMSIVGPIIKAMSFGDSLGKISTIVDNVDSLLEGKEQDHGKTIVSIPNSEIELKDVCFGYHEDKEILHNINLKVHENQLTAIVGPSGSGKSTIAKLIAGFWDVTKGTIYLGNVDEKKIPLHQLYDQVAFVTQENFLFDDTVMENLRMGNVQASDEQVVAAAKKAGCHDFIMQLENGYQTRVGGGGAHLSGGERQRIAIARAILKDAPVIILDEATAYIDPENEAIVQRAVTNLVKDKTVIVIAHRLSTISNAHKIVVVNDGHIVDEGKHEELLSRCALYQSMWKAHMDVKEGEVTC